MSTALHELAVYTTKTTTVYRKGEVIKSRGNVTIIDGFPSQPETENVVDCHFVTVGLSDELSLSLDEFCSLLARACAGEGEFRSISLQELAGGPSYIHLGAWLGSQTLALQFMALGQFYELWSVMTPAALGITGKEADDLAGNGLVMISGLSREMVLSMTRETETA